jgi:ribonuclease P protein component
MRDGDEFRRTIRRGAAASTDTVVTHVRVVDGVGVHVGLVVGKKIGDAVTRNRVKRRIRHAVRPELDRLPPGTRVVVRALPAAAARRDLAADVVGSLHRAVRRSTTPRV